MEKNGLMRFLNLQTLTDKKKENLFTAIYIGAVLIIIALIYYIHLSDNLFDGLVNFFTSLTLATVPSTGIALPAPASPATHLNLYNVAFQFSIAIGILEIIILALRVGLHSPVTRLAETIENIVFWLGTSYLIGTYLVNMTISSEWFVFWAGIILIFGLALVARSFVLLANNKTIV
jgi:hypothetical protein